VSDPHILFFHGNRFSILTRLIHIVVCKPVARQRPWKRQLYNSCCWIAAPPTDANAIIPRLQEDATIMGSCVFYAVVCIGSGLATGWSPVQGVLPTVYKIKKLKWNKNFSQMPYAPKGATGNMNEWMTSEWLCSHWRRGVNNRSVPSACLSKARYVWDRSLAECR
jgi:hypothetical protein